MTSRRCCASLPARWRRAACQARLLSLKPAKSSIRSCSTRAALAISRFSFNAGVRVCAAFSNRNLAGSGSVLILRMARVSTYAVGLIASTAVAGGFTGASAGASNPTAVHTYTTHATPNVRGGGRLRVRVSALGADAMRATFSLRVGARRATRVLLQAGPCTRNGCLDSGTASARVRISRGSVLVVRSVIVRRRAGVVLRLRTGLRHGSDRPQHRGDCRAVETGLPARTQVTAHALSSEAHVPLCMESD
jgi:hypothetical protein